MIRYLMISLLIVPFSVFTNSCMIWPGFTAIVASSKGKDDNPSLLEQALLKQAMTEQAMHEQTDDT